MNQTIREVLDFVEENDVKFVKLTFCDTFGAIRNISLLASELEYAFEKGVTIDANAVAGMEYEDEDVRLFPDPSTIQVLPWRPQHGSVIRMYCHIKHNNGEFVQSDGRHLLETTQKQLQDMGFNVAIGSDVEFYLFELDDSGKPTHVPYDRAGYLDAAPLDKGENVRREICFTIEKMGLKPLSSHHEKGPGQNEVKFRYNDALNAADDLIAFKTAVKSIAASNGLHASFMPKPIKDEEGSALKINFSLEQNTNGIDLDNATESFIAGILNRAAELTLFFSPTINSFERLSGEKAPKFIACAKKKLHQVIRMSSSDKRVIHFNAADPSCNPYIAYALLLKAGAEGLKNNMKLLQYPDIDFSLTDCKTLPMSLKEAIELAKNSSFVRENIPKKHLDYFIESKEKELKEYEECVDKDKFFEKRYFEKI